MIHRKVPLSLTHRRVSPNVYLCLARRHVLNNSRSRDRGLYSPKRCALDRLWKIERTAAGQAGSADWPVLPPAGKQTLRFAQQRFRARRLEQRLLVIARLPSLRHLLVASFPAASVTVLIWTSRVPSYSSCVVNRLFAFINMSSTVISSLQSLRYHWTSTLLTLLPSSAARNLYLSTTL
jgi:hypothetical protein